MTQEPFRVGHHPTAPTSAKKRRGWLWTAALAAAIAFVVVVSAALVLWLTVLRPVAEAITSQDAFTISGSMTIDRSAAVGGGACYGDSGHDDIHRGTQVVVTDAGGETIAIGELGSGTQESHGRCRFPFRIEGVPEGHAFYGVEVSHRGVLKYAREDLNGPLSLTLG